LAEEKPERETAADFFVTLRRRRACRSFDTARPIPDGLLKRMIYAAHRAPTGGNIPYRFLVVVKDPAQLRMLKMVSQGLFGDPPAVFVVCTKMRLREEDPPLPRMDLEECAHIDAGAAAENIALAAYSLGLGSCFVKSYSEVAVKRVLGLPAHTRTEIMVSVGYPAEDEEPPLRKSKTAKLTYIDRYGDQYPTAEASP
jgi:nitroreductase